MDNGNEKPKDRKLPVEGESTLAVPGLADFNSSEPLADIDGSHLFSEGSIIAERYRVIAKIGQGGMGAVYKVEQIALGSIQALKVLEAHKSSSKHHVRFQNEARALHHLNHPNLIRVYDFGLTANAQPFLVMDYAAGSSLHELIKSNGRLPVQRAIQIFCQVCDGVGYAHAYNIVHRDLKPSNIMLTSTPDGKTVVKIVDFGIAKFVEGDNEGGLTRTGEIFGSPFYMSPEQGLGLKIDHRSDIYSCGCALFEALTGVPPFASAAALHTMIQHQTEKPPTLKEVTLGEEFPQALEATMAKLLAKAPDDRYQSMEELKHDLQIVATGRSLDAKQPTRVSVEAKKPKLVPLLIVGVGLLLLAPIAWFVTSDQRKHEPDLIAKANTKLTEDSFLKTVHTSEFQTLSELRPQFAVIPLSQAREGWDFEFPPQQLGVISLPPGVSPTTEAQKAQGHVHFSRAYPLVFSPNWAVSERPEIFRHFRGDEIGELDLTSNINVSDDLFYFIDHLTGLHTLRFDFTDITDKGLEHIAKLPSLKDLRVTNTGVTGSGLARLKSLKNLRVLKASAIHDASKVVRALDGTKVLFAINLRRDHLTDSDVEILSRIQSLRMLYLGDNIEISNQGVSYLTNLPNLYLLDLWDCAITPDCIPSLKRIRSLQKLHLNLAQWAPEDITRLKIAIPHCHLFTDKAIDM